MFEEILVAFLRDSNNREIEPILIEEKTLVWQGESYTVSVAAVPSGAARFAA